MPTTCPAAEVWTGSGGQGLATAAICRAIRVTEGRRGEWFTSAGLQTAGIAYRRGRRGMRAVAGSCGCKHCSTHSAGYTTHHISSRSWCEQGQVITNTLWSRLHYRAYFSKYNTSNYVLNYFIQKYHTHHLNTVFISTHIRYVYDNALYQRSSLFVAFPIRLRSIFVLFADLELLQMRP